MNEIETRVHRTWVQLLVDHGYKEAAAIAVDAEIELIDQGWPEYTEDGVKFHGETILAQFHIPTKAYGYVKKSDKIREIFERALRAILENRTIRFVRYGDEYSQPDTTYRKGEVLFFDYQVRLLDVEEDWQATIRELIASSSGIRNQGSTTEFMYAKRQKEPIVHNGLNFASQSEIRIAQELEQRKILFFPLVVGVRAGTGQQYQDHREADFLICDSGVWGILEVAYHPDRYEKDKEKDGWWKKSGILCVEHHTAERCFNNPKQVVDEFLKILAQHKR